MAWNDEMTRKQLTAADGEFTPTSGQIRSFSPINANGGNIKLKNNSEKTGDDFAVGADYDTDTVGLEMLVGEKREGNYESATVYGLGIFEIFYSRQKIISDNQ